MPNSPWNIKTDNLSVTDDSGRTTYLSRENITFSSSSLPLTLSVGILNVFTSSGTTTSSYLPPAASSIGHSIKCVNLLTCSFTVNAISGNYIDGNVSGSYVVPSGNTITLTCFDANTWKTFSSPPLVAGSNITITTASNGQVTISSTGSVSWPGSSSQLLAGDGTTIAVGSGLSLSGGTLTASGSSGGGGAIYIAQSRNSTVFPHTTFLTAGMASTAIPTGTKTFYAVMSAPSGYTVESRLVDMTAGGTPTLVTLSTTSSLPVTVSGTFEASTSRRMYSVDVRVSTGSPTVNDVGFLYGTSIEVT